MATFDVITKLTSHAMHSNVVVKTFFEVSILRSRLWHWGLETKTKTLASMSQDQDLSKMNSSELESW